MKTPLRHTGTVIAAATLGLTLAACSSEEPAAVADEPTVEKETEEAAPASVEEEVVEEPTEEAPEESPEGDVGGVVDRTGTWVELDEHTVTLDWDAGEPDGVDTFAGVDAALDFLYLAAEHDTAFHAWPFYEVQEQEPIDSDATRLLAEQWFVQEIADENYQFGALTPHVSPLNLIHPILGEPRDGAYGFDVTGYDLQIGGVTGSAYTDMTYFVAMAAGNPLDGPVVTLNVELTGELAGTGDGQEATLDLPFESVSVVMALDSQGEWKVLDFNAWGEDDFAVLESN